MIARLGLALPGGFTLRTLQEYDDQGASPKMSSWIAASLRGSLCCLARHELTLIWCSRHPPTITSWQTHVNRLAAPKVNHLHEVMSLAILQTYAQAPMLLYLAAKKTGDVLFKHTFVINYGPVRECAGIT